jgi:hypothetical protein
MLLTLLSQSDKKSGPLKYSINQRLKLLSRRPESDPPQPLQMQRTFRYLGIRSAL